MEMYKDKVIKMVDAGQLPRLLYKYRSLSDGSKKYTSLIPQHYSLTLFISA